MGEDLYSTLQEQAAYQEFYDQQIPVACPNDGTPLLLGPPSQPGTWYCSHDGWRYPDDYDQRLHSGM